VLQGWGEDLSIRESTFTVLLDQPSDMISVAVGQQHVFNRFRGDAGGSKIWHKMSAVSEFVNAGIESAGVDQNPTGGCINEDDVLLPNQWVNLAMNSSVSSFYDMIWDVEIVLVDDDGSVGYNHGVVLSTNLEVVHHRVVLACTRQGDRSESKKSNQVTATHRVDEAHFGVNGGCLSMMVSGKS